MRTTVFLTTLFAISLAGGAALAEKPHGAVERMRARGDVLDKSYRASPHAASAGRGGQSVAAPARYHADLGTSRVSCSDMSVDCPTHRSVGAANVGGRSEASGKPVRAPAILEKAMGGDRTSINEAGIESGMSTRAAKRAWSHAGGAGTSAGAAAAAHSIGAERQQASMRGDAKPSENRVSCNEGDQCAASSKGTKKEWSYRAVKAGTWKGPDEKKVSPGDHAVAEMRKAKSGDTSGPNHARHERVKRSHESQQ